jgi:hypothetical protein
MLKKLGLLALAGIAVSTPMCRVSGADLAMVPSLKDGPSGSALTGAGGFWFDVDGGASVTAGTAKGTQTYVVPAQTITGPNQIVVITPAIPATDSTPEVPAVTKIIPGQTLTIPAQTVKTPVKTHISSSGFLGEARGGYAFALGNGWFAGPALGLGYTADGDSFTYSGALEVGRRFGNAQLKVGAGYLGQHDKNSAFGTGFSQDVGGFMGLAQADLFVTAHDAINVRFEEVALGSFDVSNSNSGYKYKVDNWDSRIMAGWSRHF